MADNWRGYQDEAAAFFRSLGLAAEPDATVQGVRTKHDIDVLVKSQHVGFVVTWLIECKQWRTKVSKLHVLALREIVADVGADRGVLLSEAGFQSGAFEAAELTNVKVTSLAELRISASTDILSMRLRELFDRVEECRKLYWDIPKEVRIEYGLRPEVGGNTRYSGIRVIEIASELLAKAFRGAYPVECEDVIDRDMPPRFFTLGDVVAFVDPMVHDLETRLARIVAADPAFGPR